MQTFKSGFFVDQGGYKAFKPNLVNRKYTFSDSDLLELIESANIKLGELNAYSKLVPDIDHFIKLHVLKEATVSSKIEGTNTNMEEALLKEDEINPEKRDDWREVMNYVKAMNHCIENLENLPLSSKMLKQGHGLLLKGVRGEQKLPGEFRRSQNWIGGATLRDATFIPPIHHEVDTLMSDLENFLHNNKTSLPHILKVAIAHYQFETIHPFLDGNGRIGRLLITLYFIHANILNKPVLYLSDFFERNRAAYYDNLTAVRTNNDLIQWLKFFLVGIIETANKAAKGLISIIELKAKCETERIVLLGKKMHTGQILLQSLFKDPLVRAEDVSKVTGQSMVSSYKLIEDFIRIGILKEITGNQRNRIFVFQEYFNVFK